MGREYHYWIVAKNEDTGQPYLIYGCNAREGEDAARSKGLEMLGSIDFQIRRFPTSDIGTASAMLRGKRLADGMGLHESTRRIGHEATIRRRQRQRQQERGGY